jgi:hypothetical protein
MAAPVEEPDFDPGPPPSAEFEEEVAQPEAEPPLAAAVGDAPDITRIRELWPAAVDAVREDNGMVGAFLAAAQPAELEGQMLTLAFAPEATFGKKKCEDNRALLQTALRALTGHALQVRCECREIDATASASTGVTLSDDELVDRLKEQFGAKEVFDEPAPPNGDA